MRLSLLALALCAGCGGGPVSGSTAAAACITANACSMAVGSVTNCSSIIAGVSDPFVAAGAQISASEVSCVANAGHDCAAARKCFNGGETPGQCTGNGGSCTGTTINGCSAFAGSGGQNGTTKFDCNIDGEMCVVSNGNLGCGVGTCTGDMCMGDIHVQCNNGITRNQDCSKYDSTCAVTNLGPVSFYHCRGKGPACTQSDPNKGIRCEGATAIFCYDGQEAKVDCGSYGQGCFPNIRQSGAFGCGLGGDCDPGTFKDSCAGGVLTFCNNGKIDTYNCTGNGFSSCNVNNQGGCAI
jgi:hypothetical protein